MNEQTILFSVENSVAKITLNRPKVLNSFNHTMSLALQEALKNADEDKTVRALYLTGEGHAFCAGQDLEEVLPQKGIETDLGAIVKSNYNTVIRKIRNIEKPVICAVNGVAAGAGANLAFACDVTFAALSATFIQSFGKLGLIPDSGGTFFLPRLVGMQRATGLMFSGQRLLAERACDMGLIYAICQDEKLHEKALGFAQKLATLPTKGFGLTKRGLNQSLFNNLDDQLDFEEDLQRQAGRTQDYNEGVNAFIEKRKPVFTGE